MRLIDADRLSEAIYDNVPAPYEDASWAKENCLAEIEAAQTIDAVPVVRCRECKHHRDKNEQEQQYLVEDVLICTSPDVGDDCWSAVWPYHFCSYGERKGSDGNVLHGE